MSGGIQKVYFVAGVVARQNVAGIAAYLIELQKSDREFTRFYMYNHDSGQWFQQEVEHHIVSIEYRRLGKDFTWYLLSKRGTLIKISPSGSYELQIPDADTGPGGLGYVNQIRVIGNGLYVCGFRRQVYRLDGDEFTHIDAEIISPQDDRDHSLEGIDGVSEDNIYAVGWHGEIFNYNGAQWRRIEVPTNSNLTSVKCINEDIVYACGYNGTVIRGEGDQWELVQDPQVRQHLWAVDAFQGKPYFAHLDGILTLENQRLVIALNASGYRLHARDEVMWSFGNDDLFFFDGQTWTEIVCPDNE